MIVEKSGQIIREIGKVLIGKDEVVEKGFDDHLCRRTYSAGRCARCR